MGFLIDSRGQIVERAASMAQGPDQEEERSLVAGDGHVWVSQIRDAWFVWLNPAFVTPPAEAALYYLLSDVARGRIVVSFSPDRDGYTIFPSVTHAIAGVGDELTSHRRLTTNRFASRMVGMRSICACPPLHMLHSAFSMSAQVKGPSDIETLLTHVLQNRFLIAQYASGRKRIIIRALGLGYSGFDSRWAKTAAGRPLDEQPDIEYATWLAHTYRSSFASGEPVAEEVDAAVFRPNFGRRRFGYLRLILPFTDSEGAECLLSASVPDPGVDLGIN